MGLRNNFSKLLILPSALHVFCYIGNGKHSVLAMFFSLQCNVRLRLEFADDDAATAAADDDGDDDIAADDRRKGGASGGKKLTVGVPKKGPPTYDRSD